SDSIDWRGILRAHKINHVVIYSSNADEAERALGNLIARKQEWPLLYLGEGAAVFGWGDPLLGGTNKKLGPTPVAADAFAGLETNLDRLAFSPKEARAIATTATDSQPRSFHWWHAFWKKRPIRAPHLNEARLALTAYNALGPMHHARSVTVWNACASAGLVAEECSRLGFSFFPGTAVVRRDLFFSGRDGGPPAALFLAIRAARRAIEEDPTNPRAYFALGEAYFH